MNKISICTVCMNRLQHLSETFLHNIKSNMSYPAVEFVLLDYNSPDGTEEWAKEHLQEYINAGIVNYYKTYEPRFFDLSHSKNMSMKLATGDVVCMVDADNFAGEEYVHWVDKMFQEHSRQAVITTLRRDSIPYRDQGGKMAFHRDLLHAVKGFDECMVGYGVDDVDLVNRLENIGGKRVFIDDEKFLYYIPHSNFERVKNYSLMENFVDMHIKVTDNMKTRVQIIFWLKDNTFYDVSYEHDEAISNNAILGYGGWRISPNGHRSGTYEQSEGQVLLTYSNGETMILEPGTEEHLHQKGEENTVIRWRPLSRKPEVFSGMIFFYTECFNRYSCIINTKPLEEINQEGWGRGMVYRNFDRSQPVFVN